MRPADDLGSYPAVRPGDVDDVNGLANAYTKWALNGDQGRSASKARASKMLSAKGPSALRERSFSILALPGAFGVVRCRDAFRPTTLNRRSMRPSSRIRSKGLEGYSDWPGPPASGRVR